MTVAFAIAAIAGLSSLALWLMDDLDESSASLAVIGGAALFQVSLMSFAFACGMWVQG